MKQQGISFGKSAVAMFSIPAACSMPALHAKEPLRKATAAEARDAATRIPGVFSGLPEFPEARPDIKLPERPGTYCYSEQASSQLEPADMVSSDRVGKALEKHRKRLGLEAFRCTDGK
jgi:hypothetical protein